ncbi:hypothetical protein A1O1_00274 [Capronia coronata CBS 617.96]|uniref:Uncharacterized protein n=1 Tax=Capronia coronata CBS 617.96 TaxID=1182541 RepID=W9YZN1_9EURO|nr:uncharacterized protein A1O1_00274 [Capronia coronata CBS 617.96]EXJ95155.1 hypothetical protein A1O1_00274 [Capronia coronata CBS 617.96]
MSKQKKPVHALSLPYPDPQWPPVSSDQEQAVLQLLLPLLRPIGEFKRSHVPQSKGKGRAGKTVDTANNDLMPDLYTHLTIGFNSTVRRLEALAGDRSPAILSAPTTTTTPSQNPVNLSVVFVCRQNLPDIMSSSMPLLVATSAPVSSRSQLVELSPQAEAKIAQALQQPRVGVLGLEEGASDAGALLRLVAETFETVTVPWLDQPQRPHYFPVKVKTTLAGNKVNRKRKQPDEG